METTTDLTYLLKFCDGNKEKVNKYIDVFIKSTAPIPERIKTALTAGDYLEIANQVHGCKTKFTMMGMKQAFELAQSIENQCRDGNISEGLKGEIDSLLVIIPRAVDELKTAATG